MADLYCAVQNSQNILLGYTEGKDIFTLVVIKESNTYPSEHTFKTKAPIKWLTDSFFQITEEAQITVFQLTDTTVTMIYTLVSKKYNEMSSKNSEHILMGQFINFQKTSTTDLNLTYSHKGNNILFHKPICLGNKLFIYVISNGVITDNNKNFVSVKHRITPYDEHVIINLENMKVTYLSSLLGVTPYEIFSNPSGTFIFCFDNKTFNFRGFNVTNGRCVHTVKLFNFKCLPVVEWLDDQHVKFDHQVYEIYEFCDISLNTTNAVNPEAKIVETFDHSKDNLCLKFIRCGDQYRLQYYEGYSKNIISLLDKEAIDWKGEKLIKLENKHYIVHDKTDKENPYFM